MMERETLEVELRKVDNKELGYLAVVKKFGLGVFFAYVRDDVYGAVVLNQFMEMIRAEFGAKKVVIKMTDKKIEIKSRFLLDTLFSAELQYGSESSEESVRELPL